MRMQAAVVGHELERLFGLGVTGTLTDAQLVAVFVGADERFAALAFEAIVERHGPRVMRTCRMVLREFHAAEDAFQATFLVLARRAHSLGSPELLGNWLQGVAIRTSRKAKALAAEQGRREHEFAVERASAFDEPGRYELDEAYGVLHQEIDRLPRSYRSAIALCYLEGKSHSEAAAQLGLSESTIRGRLARARKLLDRRLNRRDQSPALALPALCGSSFQGGALPAGTIQATARAALCFLNGCQANPVAVSLRSRALANGELSTMWLYRAKTIAAGIALIGGITALGLVFTQAAAKAQLKNGDEASKPEASAVLEPVPGPGAAGTNSERTEQPDVSLEQGKSVSVDPELAKLAGGSIVRTVAVSKDCMILSYLPNWAHGNVDNIGLGNNDGGNRMLINWQAGIPADEANLPDHRVVIAVYSRETISHPPAGPIMAFEITEEWQERSSWLSRPSYNPEPVATYKFEPEKGWKLFDVTPLVRAQAKAGRKGHGVLLRFVSEDLKSESHSDYKCVSREGTGEWQTRRPLVLIVKGGSQ
jgi:RNA polymerase sigma factor (sigma-70 family)